MKNKICCLLAVLLGHIVATEGECKISEPTRCDLTERRVVNYIMINTTCPDNDAELEGGKSYDVIINFTPAKSAENAKSAVVVFFMGLQIPVDVTSGDACAEKGITCPLEANKTYDFNPSFQVVPDFQVTVDLKATLFWALVGDKGENIFCAKLDITVKKPPSYYLPSNESEPQLTFREVP